MKILGIDPGLATVGFAFLQDEKLLDYGVVSTPSGASLPERLWTLGEDINELLAEFSPDIAAVEELFFVQNVTNGMAVAHARGVILHAICQKGIPLLEVSPKDVKLSVCGYGNAPKQQIQKAVQNIFRLPKPPHPDDAADAIAVAYWGLQQKSSAFMVDRGK
jgi:crossover junction endodeoxyribonuclease RuvC